MAHFKYKPNHLFHSFTTNSSWLITTITDTHVMVVDMRYRETTMPYRTPEQIDAAITDMNYAKAIKIEDFEKALANNSITFDKHEFQNQTIDACADNKDIKQAYAKNKHWGGTR